MAPLAEFLRGTYLWRRYQRYLRKHSDDAKTAFTARYEFEVTRPGGRPETVCGAGSTMAQTRVARETISRIVRERGITSMLDAPCGDLNWMRHVDLGGVRYVGGDVVQKLVEENRARFGGEGKEFVLMDIIKDVPAPVDLILCRDCLVHLPNADALAAVRNFSASGSKYLLSTTFPATERNADLKHPGEWRAINLRMPPFSLQEPLELIDEECPDANGRSKSLGLWGLPV